MKIIKLNSKPNKDGYFDIPKNLVNRDMFCYPKHKVESTHRGLKQWEIISNQFIENENRKINAIVCYYGELFKDRLWSIGLMGYENIIIFDDNGIEIDCYYRNYEYNNGIFLYKFNGENDYLNYFKNKTIYLRTEKIYKIKNKWEKH
jgi:hypothetical protein